MEVLGVIWPFGQDTKFYLVKKRSGSVLFKKAEIQRWIGIRERDLGSFSFLTGLDRKFCFIYIKANFN